MHLQSVSDENVNLAILAHDDEACTRLEKENDRGCASLMQTCHMITEHAILSVRPGQQLEFEAAFETARPLISSQPGFEKLSLLRSIESPHLYVLLVVWADVESHTLGFGDRSDSVLRTVRHVRETPPQLFGAASSFAKRQSSFIAAAVIRFAIPLKMMPWKGRIATQYSRPESPFGKKIARW